MYVDPTGHCKDYGNGFITISGEKMPIYIPGYTDGSNTNFTDEGWTIRQDMSITKTNWEVDWLKTFSDYGSALEEDKGIQYKEVGNKQIMDHGNFTGGGKVQASLIVLEAINKVVDNTKRNVLSITVQENTDYGQKRATIQIGSYNNKFMKKAGQKYDMLAFGYWAEPGHNTAVDGLNDYLTTLGYGEYVEGSEHTNVKATVDINHKSDPFIGYIGVNKNNELTLTPKLYKDHNIQITNEKHILGFYYGDYDVKYNMYNDLRNAAPSIIKNNSLVNDVFKEVHISN
jgi:hypothetical protein